MTEFKKAIYNDDKYYINKNQFFLFDEGYVKKKLSQLPFPMIIMDTEFFNKSHNTSKIPTALYDEKTPDLIYTLSFSIVKSYKELLKRNNENSITTYSIKKRMTDKDFDFQKEMNKILTKFFNLAIKQKINCLVFGGKANDEKILNRWINQHKAILNNKVSKLFIKNKDDDSIKINAFDIYPILEHGISVNNAIDHEKKYDEKDNLKKGLIGENTVQIPSLKRFFDYIKLFPNIESLKEDDQIYRLCVDVLKLFTLNLQDQNKFRKYNNSLKKAIKHCKNDVTKLLYLVLFLYCFAYLDQANNPFVKQKSKNLMGKNSKIEIKKGS